MSLRDSDVLEAIQKGTLYLKIKVLRAAGLVRGTWPNFEVSPDAGDAIAELRRAERQVNSIVSSFVQELERLSREDRAEVLSQVNMHYCPHCGGCSACGCRADEWSDR